jgi:type III secretion system FlhB-like substrate exporter
MNAMADTKVVGVSYDPGDVAPLVMLKAAGADAETLVQQAKLRDDLPVIRDPALVNQLYRVPMDTPIGRELFPVMALLLAHVLRVDRDRQSVERVGRGE